MGADRGERPWWNAVGRETVVTRVAAAWYDRWGQQGTVRPPLVASPRFAWLVAEHLPQFRLICLRFFETNLS